MAIYIYNYISMPLYSRILNRRIFCILATIQMFLILALRADTVGVDFVTYSAAFDYIAGLGLSDMLSKIRILRTATLPYPFDLESGWMILNWLISHLGLGFRSVIVLCAAVNMYALGRFIYKYSSAPWMSFCISAAMSTYQYMFGILRQSLALSLVILALDAYNSKKRKCAICLLIIAFFIHRTAILAIVLFLVFWALKRMALDKTKYRTVLALWVPFVVFAPFIYSRVLASIMSALGKGGYAGHGMQWNNMLGLLLVIAVFNLAFLDFKKLQTTMETLFAWAIVVALYWGTIGMFNDTLSRSKEYFAFFTVMDIPMVLSYYSPKKIAQLGRGAVFGLLFVYMIHSLNGSELVPYSVFFR